VDGIAQWWLDLTPASVGLVERALDVLQQAGVVVGARAPHGRGQLRRRMPAAHTDAAAIEADRERRCRARAVPGNAQPPPRP